MAEVNRNHYRALLGPTTQDRIRLADTDLWIEVTEDRCSQGDEAVFWGRQGPARIDGPGSDH